ncbi:DUF2332 family protein [Pseudolysinimonas sp.]
MESRTATGYAKWAALEASGQSPIYYEWAVGLSADADLISLVDELPRVKKQPNLVFAAARSVGAPVGPYGAFRSWMLANWEAVRRVIMQRSTQTNEAARCAVLLPVLSRLRGPLALIEVGAAAGLCLYPDRYSYRYLADEVAHRLDPSDGPSSVELECAIDRASIPDRLPEVAWRAGIDLNPISVSDPDQLGWLEALVWPEHEARRVRLRRAAELVALDPPHLVAGDLSRGLDNVIEAAPTGTHVVVFHSAVLSYVDQPGREAFAERMVNDDRVTWLSNEGEPVFSSIAAAAGGRANGRMILAVDGRPVAYTGPHGQSYDPV